jgi:hypothetical protein
MSETNPSKKLFGRPHTPAVNAHRKWSKIKTRFSHLTKVFEEEVKAEIGRRYEIEPKVSPEEGQSREVHKTTQPATQPGIYRKKAQVEEIAEEALEGKAPTGANMGHEAH